MQTKNTQNVVYGIHPVTELIRQRPEDVDRIYFLQGRQSAVQFDLLKECRRRRLPYQMVPAQRLSYLVPKGVHQGVVALCAVRRYTLFDDVVAGLDATERPGLILVPASVSDPHNLGSIIRSSVAFGVDAVLLEKGNTSPLTEVVAKCSAGMLEHAAVCRPRSLEAAIDQLKQLGFVVIGAEAGAEQSVEEARLDRSVVLIVGGEHRGIPPYLAKRCDLRVRIPLAPQVESLNVSVAAGIMLYECDRQRRGA